MPVHKYDMSSVAALLCRIAETDKPVIFDVSGGDDYILAAAGVAYENAVKRDLTRVFRISACVRDGLRSLTIRS